MQEFPTSWRNNVIFAEYIKSNQMEISPIWKNWQSNFIFFVTYKKWFNENVEHFFVKNRPLMKFIRLIFWYIFWFLIKSNFEKIILWLCSTPKVNMGKKWRKVLASVIGFLALLIDSKYFKLRFLTFKYIIQ